MHHGTEFSVVILVILVSLVLCLGAVVRLAFGFLRVPYTIAMLVIGLRVGVLRCGSLRVCCTSPDRLPNIEDMLAEIPFFALLDKTQRERVASVGRTVVVPVGEVLFRQGDRGDSLFVIIRCALAARGATKGS